MFAHDRMVLMMINSDFTTIHTIPVPLSSKWPATKLAGRDYRCHFQESRLEQVSSKAYRGGQEHGIYGSARQI